MQEEPIVGVMFGKSKATGASRGVLVETWSGNTSEEIFELGQRNDVYHIVRVSNLRTYDVEIECIGRIEKGEQHVLFDDPLEDGTSWRKLVRFRGASSGTIGGARLRAISSGTAVVFTEITIRWAEPEIVEVISMYFLVSA